MKTINVEITQSEYYQFEVEVEDGASPDSVFDAVSDHMDYASPTGAEWTAYSIDGEDQFAGPKFLDDTDKSIIVAALRALQESVSLPGMRASSHLLYEASQVYQKKGLLERLDELAEYVNLDM